VAGSRLSRGLCVGRDEVVTVALQPHRLVQGARAARPGRLGAPLRIGSHQACLGRAGADTALSGFRDPPLGDWRGLRRLQSPEFGHHLGRFRSHGQPRRRIRPATALGTIDNRYIASLGMRHTFIPEWRWFSPTAGLGFGYQYIDDKVPPKPLQTSNQLAYVSLGVRGFITRRFMWRADWRKYVVFTNQNQNEEPEDGNSA